MDGKTVVVTGAFGALGRVVAEAALARGARVAGVDHAASQVAASANRIELGGVDLTDPALIPDQILLALLKQLRNGKLSMLHGR